MLAPSKAHSFHAHLTATHATHWEREREKGDNGASQFSSVGAITVASGTVCCVLLLKLIIHLKIPRKVKSSQGSQQSVWSAMNNGKQQHSTAQHILHTAVAAGWCDKIVVDNWGQNTGRKLRETKREKENPSLLAVFASAVHFPLLFSSSSCCLCHLRFFFFFLKHNLRDSEQSSLLSQVAAAIFAFFVAKGRHLYFLLAILLALLSYSNWKKADTKRLH